MTPLLIVLLELVPATTAQVHDQLTSQWTTIVNADKTFGAWEVSLGAATYQGDWVLRLSGWTYYGRDGKVVCREQSSEYVTCGERDFVPLTGARIIIQADPKQPAPTLATLRGLHRALWGNQAIAIDDRGRASIETIVSEPFAERRTSQRYRVDARLSTRGFTLGAPRLLARYDERCTPIHGCHSTHWHCQRIGD